MISSPFITAAASKLGAFLSTNDMVCKTAGAVFLFSSVKIMELLLCRGRRSPALEPHVIPFISHRAGDRLSLQNDST